MDFKLNKSIKQNKHSRNLAGMLGFVLLLALASFAFYAWGDKANQNVAVQNVTNKAEAMNKSKPTKLQIPKLGVDAGVIELGLQKDNTMEVPENGSDAGWYIHSPTPGEIGPSVIAGHYDTEKGPAIFYKLDKLSVGDEILVQREDNTTAKFTVEKIEQYPQDNFPTIQVYGPTSYPGLRLITCAGQFRERADRYSHNLVVYARLVE
jgi:LPXTG-site transpeptidase (sortase) family protein